MWADGKSGGLQQKECDEKAYVPDSEATELGVDVGAVEEVSLHAPVRAKSVENRGRGIADCGGELDAVWPVSQPDEEDEAAGKHSEKDGREEDESTG